MSLHVVYADTSDTIAYQLVGEAPRRRKGWGVIPLAGWDPDAGWADDRVPFQEMPHIADPPGGIVASANNQPTPEGEGPFLGVDWLDGYRVARIFESLQAGREWDLQSVRALHMDQESIAWRDMRDYVLASPVTSEEGRRAVSLLEGWDGVVSSESPAAAVFELFLTDMTRRTVEAKAPLASAWALGQGSSLLVPLTFFAARRVGHLVRLLREQPEGWFPETWDEVIAGSLAAAVQVLRKRCGDDQRQWAWGRIRPLTLRHSLGHKSLLGRVYNLGPFPCGGDTNTISQAAPPPTDPLANPLAIASARMVVDVGDWEESRFVLPGGQSGNPLSPHYGDMLPLWRRGDGVPIAWSPEAVRDATVATLRLSPASTSQ
jgi:penicillin amidase